MSKRIFALLAAVTVLCLALFSCGEDDDTQGSSESTGSSIRSSTSPSIAGDGSSGTFGVDFGELFG